MSSIVYVTDENMIEYHRLYGSTSMNFWRPSSKKDFRHFGHGDLLFFFTKTSNMNRKGIVGYAHFNEIVKLSLNQMWDRYTTKNGFSSKEQLRQAIQMASKDKKIPKQMNCLSLYDVVFFSSPIYPENCGLNISSKLESYCYIKDEEVQLLLRQAQANGIDLWSTAIGFDPGNIFYQDRVLNTVSAIFETYPIHDLKLMKPIMQTFAKENPHLKQLSTLPIFYQFGGMLELWIPFVSLKKQYEKKVLQYIGLLKLFQHQFGKSDLNTQRIQYHIFGQESKEIEEIVEEMNNEK